MCFPTQKMQIKNARAQTASLLADELKFAPVVQKYD